MNIKMNDVWNRIYKKEIEHLIEIDDAWKNEEFTRILELKHVERWTGIVLFYSVCPKEIYDYLKGLGIIRIRPWDLFFYINEDNELYLYGKGEFNFRLKKDKNKKKKKGNVPGHIRNKEIDNEHTNIKGQKRIGFWG